ncbi:ROST-like protein [Mya arenaria]|uniref:ROST-like protein n=1 Tax=Mya arenaria TaxID=6604 RepID=A0ABY7FX89_MYAAR|nr:protein rolling stone-like [Mya arenaria]WAR26797.1 ROST-like protein [Mya arenaria]
MVDCREEFRLKSFLFQHEDPQIFVQFQFGKQTAYLVWRIFWALYHIAWIIVSGIYVEQWAGPDSSQHVKWFIFLTNWAYFTLTVATIVDAAVVGYVFFKRRDILKGIADFMPWYLRADWCLATMAGVVSVTTSIVYWGLVYNGRDITAVDASTHLINSVYVIANVFLTGMPMRILHFWFSVLYALVYSLFTVVYYFAGGTNHNENPYVYPQLNWDEKPGTAAMYCVIVTFVAVSIVHLILFGFYSLKVFISSRVGLCDPVPELEDIRSPTHSNIEMKMPEY